MPSGWLELALALLATALGQALYKLYFLRRRWVHLIAAMCFFLLAPACNYMALRALSIGTVYMSTGLTHLLVMFLSYWLLDETLTRHHAIGMALIIPGVYLYAG